MTFTGDNYFYAGHVPQPALHAGLLDQPGAASDIRDQYDLQRFIAAQERTYADVIAELKAGKKNGDWTCYIFPQVMGLGSGAISQDYAISSMDEARAYLAHPLLGARLKECSELVRDRNDSTIREIFGKLDARKFRASMTLFARAAKDCRLFAEHQRVFNECLTKCPGGPDSLTLAMLRLP